MSASRFGGKTIVITGGGSGIGYATAERVAREGANVTLVDNTAEELEAAGARLLEVIPEAEVLTVLGDVSDRAHVQTAVARTMERFGRIDGLFNNAGRDGPLVPLHEYPTADFERVVGVNLMGTFFGMKYTLGIMKAQGGGIIVNNSSVGGIRGFATRSAYSATKHAIVGLTRTAGVEYGRFGISIICLVPGLFSTPMSEASIYRTGGVNWERVQDAVAAANPMGRFGRVEEAASLTAFLLSGEAPYINGTTVTIDGGQTEAF